MFNFYSIYLKKKKTEEHSTERIENVPYEWKHTIIFRNKIVRKKHVLLDDDDVLNELTDSLVSHVLK